MAYVGDFDQLLMDVRMYTNCSGRLVSGYERLLAELSASSSLTSRRYSVWAAVRRNMDDAFFESLAGFKGEWNQELLANCTLSEMGKYPPPILATRNGTVDSAYSKALVEFTQEGAGQTLERWQMPRPQPELPRRPFNDGWDFKAVSKRLGKPASVLPIDWQISNIDAWGKNFSCALSNLRCRTDDTCEIRDTLDFVLSKLIPLLKRFRPARTTTHLEHDSLSDAKTRSQELSYCELCWRLTIRSARLYSLQSLMAGHGGMQGDQIKAGRLSARYCAVHSPGSARYHADLRYKAAFAHEVQAQVHMGASRYAVQLCPRNMRSTEAVRKAAYELVHSKLRPIRTEHPQVLGLREKVDLLTKEGLSQSEMARRLGISRQAVSKAIKSMKALKAAHVASCKWDERTGEVLVSDSVRDRIRLGLEQHESVAAIAKAVGLTKATVEDISLRTCIALDRRVALPPTCVCIQLDQ